MCLQYELLTDGGVTAGRLHAQRPDVGGLPDPALAAPRVLRPVLHHQGGVLARYIIFIVVVLPQ